MITESQRLVFLALVVAPVICLGCGDSNGLSAPHSPPSPANAQQLSSGDRIDRPIDRPIDDADTHVYSVVLAAGEFVQVSLQQRTIDVTLSLSDPDDRQLISVDLASRGSGLEVLSAITSKTGSHRIIVSAQPASSTAAADTGSYSLRIESGPVVAADRQRVSAARAMYAGDQARRLGTASEQALAHYETAAAGFRAADDPYREGVAEYRLGTLYRRLKRPASALDAYGRAAVAYRSANAVGSEMRALNWVGRLSRGAADYVMAITAFTQAMELAEKLDDKGFQANLANSLASVHNDIGAFAVALTFYDRAIAGYLAVGRPVDRGTALSNKAQVLITLGDLQSARKLLEQAIGLWRGADRSQLMAVALTSLGTIHRRLGRLGPSRKALAEAETLRRQNDQTRGLAVTLLELGLTDLAATSFESAARSFTGALALARQTGARRVEGFALANLAWLEELQDQHEPALAHYHSALAIFEGLTERQGEASARVGIAKIEALRGRLHHARHQIEAALAHIENLRQGTEDPGLRSSFLARKRDYYEIAVDILMQLDEHEPDKGWAAQALAASEKGKARSLLDSLARSHPDLRLGSNRALVERYAAFSAPALPTAPAVQNLLDDDTLMLAYSVGAHRSYVWRVSRRSLSGHVLPGRTELAALTRQTQFVAGRSHLTSARVQSRLLLRKLGDLLLSPAAGDLQYQRLVIVPDDALHWVPFSALIEPESQRTLLANHELVSVPSIGVLMQLRRLATSRPQAEKTLVVVGDPQYASSGSELPPPLHHARREVQAILQLVAPWDRQAFLGSEANVRSMTEGALADYRLIHFAAHARFESDHPERSGILLSAVDSSGHRFPGLLDASHVHGLKLNADLVVLSACQTALGRELRGEGLVGLTHGFFYAGAPRVLVSLWNVDDQATAELMMHFYRSLLTEDLAPAAALRHAQLLIRRDPRWSAPFFWAGFVLQGEWR